MKRLRYLPVNLFAATMGTAGLALAEQRAGLPLLADALAYLALAGYVALTGGYLYKLFAHTAEAAAEFSSPARIPFFATMSMTGLLLASHFYVVVPVASQVLFWLSTALQAVVVTGIFTRWIHSTNHSIDDVLPTWFIPTAGNILVAVAANNAAELEAGWVFFAVGVVLWLPVFAITMLRLSTGSEIPAAAMPTLSILVNPPSIAFLAWVKLHNGQVDDFARIMAYFAMFFAVVVAVQLAVKHPRKFTLSLWSPIFPFAALASTMIEFGTVLGNSYVHFAGVVLAQLLALAVLLLTVATLRAGAKGSLLKPENS